MFTAPEMKDRYPEWENEARSMLESFRANYDFWSDAPEFIALVADLKRLSPEFQRWWTDMESASAVRGEAHAASETGLIRMSYATFQCNDNPDIGLSPTADLLGSGMTSSQQMSAPTVFGEKMVSARVHTTAPWLR